MSSSYDEEECQEWLDKVQRVQQAIHNLNTQQPGALQEADRLHEAFCREQEDKAAQKKKDTEPVLFRKGDGWKNEYKLYCTGCLCEILIDVNECPQCRYPKLVTLLREWYPS